MKMFWQNAIIRGVFIGGLLSFCIHGLSILAHWYAVSPSGNYAVLILPLLLVLTLLIALVGLPISLLGMLFKRTRRIAFISAIACLVFFVVGLACIRISMSVRMLAFHKVAERSTLLIEAIKRFEVEQGRILGELGELVPDFLTAIPKTGVGAYPEYEYLLPGPERIFCGEPWPEGNDWILVVYAPVVGGWDMFIYFPTGDYPKYAYSSWLQRIGAWAYCHE